jgi:hypothetical protein
VLVDCAGDSLDGAWRAWIIPRPEGPPGGKIRRLFSCGFEVHLTSTGAHIMAVVKLRNTAQGRAYFNSKKAAGKTSMEAMRTALAEYLIRAGERRYLGVAASTARRTRGCAHIGVITAA